MPVDKLNFGNLQETGNQQLAGASPLAINVLTDGRGAVRRRPGISAWSGFPSTAPRSAAVIGLYAWAGVVYYIDEDRFVYAVWDGEATNLSTTGPASFLAGSARPVFAETQFRLVVAGGDAPQKIERDEDGVDTTARLGGDPPVCDHVIAMSSRVFVNDLTSATTYGQIRFSGIADAGNEEFDPLDVVTAEARPDALISLRENTNEAWAFGATTCQVMAPDPVTVLAPSRTMNYGCAAGSSVVQMGEANDAFGWLDHTQNIVLADGRAVDAIGDPIAETLGAIADATDCWGFRYLDGQFDSSQWVFPADGRTFSYQTGGGWAQWQGWQNGSGHTLLPVTAVHRWDEQGIHLVGRSDGTIAKFDLAAGTDLGDPIKAEVLTGFMNQGTDTIKSADVLRLTIKRGETDSSSDEPVLLLSWRDSLGAFKSPMRIGLGVAGDDVFTVEKRTLGMYRSRQWKLEFSDAADFVLVSAELTWSPGEGN